MPCMQITFAFRLLLSPPANKRQHRNQFSHFIRSLLCYFPWHDVKWANWLPPWLHKAQTLSTNINIQRPFDLHRPLQRYDHNYFLMESFFTGSLCVSRRAIIVDDEKWEAFLIARFAFVAHALTENGVLPQTTVQTLLLSRLRQLADDV